MSAETQVCSYKNKAVGFNSSIPVQALVNFRIIKYISPNLHHTKGPIIVDEFLWFDTKSLFDQAAIPALPLN